MTDVCDLCRKPALEAVYQPIGGARGLTVHVCTHCGLVQSLPRADRAPRTSVAVSSGADWGNVRYGKGFRTDACLSLLRAQADVNRPLSVLDVGSNRGSFARALIAAAPCARLACVEPDERVAGSCDGLARTQLIRARIEDAAFPDECFDVIHSCHTIEHLASPASTLAAHWRALKPGGLLVVDAPDIALIGGDDIIEEWFIDKHLYHFSARTLSQILLTAGFEILAGPEPGDGTNLLVAARKHVFAPRCPAGNTEEVEAARRLIAAYCETRPRNFSALTRVAAEITSWREKRVALWGAGRLFDALVLHGGLNPKMLALLVDAHLPDHIRERHGVALMSPEALIGADPGVIVVMSRAFAGEIARKAKLFAPMADIVLYTDLIGRARARLAA